MPLPHVKVDVDPHSVVKELRPSQLNELRSMIPSARLHLEPELLATYSRDESPVYPALPAAVVRVTSTKEAAMVLSFADRERIPITARGAGSGKVGGAIPLYGGIVLSLELMNRILRIDAANRLAQVEPGVITAALRVSANDAGLFYPVDPNSLDICSMGGNVAANAAGPSSMKYGATRDQLLALEVVLADGSTLRVGRETTKCSTGYDLPGIICGSEGTLAVITQVTVRLRARPVESRTLFAFFDDTHDAIATLTDIYRKGITPVAAEFFDAHALATISGALPVPAGSHAALLLELDGTAASIDEALERLLEVFSGPRAGNILMAKDEAERRRLWEARKILSVKVKERFKRYVSEDVAVPPGKLPHIVDFIGRLRAESGLEIVSYGHAGDGNLHVNFLYQEALEHDDVEAAVEKLFIKVIELGGTLSGEHGIGASKRRFMHLEQSPLQISLQRRIKTMWDPHGILNPGKIFP